MGPPQEAEAIIELLRELPDPRSTKNLEYPLEEILFLVLAAMLSGLNQITSIAMFGEEKLEWLRTFLPYVEGTPSHHTIGRVLRLLCPDALEIMFARWMEGVDRMDKVAHACPTSCRADLRTPGLQRCLVALEPT